MTKNQSTKPSAVKNPIIAGDNDPRHGTPTGYIYHKCRCALCTAAHSAQCLAGRAARQVVVLLADDPRHGKSSTYTNHGCRCVECRKAWAGYVRELRQRNKGPAAN